MKKIICLILLVCTVLSFTGCSNPTTAKWDGYDESSFLIFLEQGFKATHERHHWLSTSCEEEWNITPTDEEFMDPDDVSKGSKPYTYSVTVKGYDATDFDKKANYKFFMELKGSLTVKGAQIERDGYVRNLSSSEAKDYLEDVKIILERRD